MLQVVKVDMGAYKHLAFISNKFFQGKPMLISNTMRKGSVYEEPWDTVVGSRRFKIETIETSEPASQVLDRARSYIGKAKYDLFGFNCEHFVSKVVTGIPKSPQIQAAAISATILFLGYMLRKS